MIDDEFYRDRAQHIRKLGDKADPFICKLLLDLAGNYDAMVRRSHRATAVVRPSSRTSRRTACLNTSGSSARRTSPRGSVCDFNLGDFLGCN
jgi:hypothetical protein